MSNSPGFRGAATGSAVPNSFSSSPNSGTPFQRTCQMARAGCFVPSNSIDVSLSRNVANPLAATLGSLITHPTAVTVRGRSPSRFPSCCPSVLVVANLCSRKKPAATTRYVPVNLGQHARRRMPAARTNAAGTNAVNRTGKISATTIPVMAISARPTNG